MLTRHDTLSTLGGIFQIQIQNQIQTSDGLSESFVGLREPFIDISGSHLVVLCQPEMILLRPKRGLGHGLSGRTLRCLRVLRASLIWSSVGLR